jgi:hypothetical protein
MYYHEMSIYEKLLTHGRPGRGGPGRDERSSRARGGGGGQPCSMEPNSRFHVSKCTDSPGDTHQIPVSEFPSFRGPSVGPQRDPKKQIPCFQVCRFQDTPLQIPVIPSFRVSKAPLWVRGGTPISKFLVSWWADSRILLRKFQIPRFRVCRFQDIPGQIPDSVFPSFRGPLLGPSPREHLRSTTPKFQIPSFRVSEVPSSVQGRGTPKSPQIPDSEFPSFRGPLLALGSQQEGLANSQIPSFRV